jgi:hypothetical protein
MLRRLWQWAVVALLLVIPHDLTAVSAQTTSQATTQIPNCAPEHTLASWTSQVENFTAALRLECDSQVSGTTGPGSDKLKDWWAANQNDVKRTVDFSSLGAFASMQGGKLVFAGEQYAALPALRADRVATIKFSFPGHTTGISEMVGYSGGLVFDLFTNHRNNKCQMHLVALNLHTPSVLFGWSGWTFEDSSLACNASTHTLSIAVNSNWVEFYLDERRAHNIVGWPHIRAPIGSAALLHVKSDGAGLNIHEFTMWDVSSGSGCFQCHDDKGDNCVDERIWPLFACDSPSGPCKCFSGSEYAGAKTAAECALDSQDLTSIDIEEPNIEQLPPSENCELRCVSAAAGMGGGVAPLALLWSALVVMIRA